jgi:hypothetical protein
MMMNGRRSTSDKLVIFGSVAALLVVVLLCWFLTNMIVNFTSGFVPLVTGAMLLIGNRAGLIELIRTRQPSPTVLNAMIGVALLLFGLGTTIFGTTPPVILFYAPAMALLLVALPVALSKPAMYSTYRNWANSAMGAIRRVTNRGGQVNPAASTINGSFDHSRGQQTIDLDPNAVSQANQPRRP